jgi:hypothetical protein
VMTPEDVEVGNTNLLTTFSVDGEYTSNSLSEPRRCLLSDSTRGSALLFLGSRSESLRIDPRGCSLTCLHPTCDTFTGA